MSPTDIEHLSTLGKEYISQQTHMVAQNLYSGKMEELLRMPSEDIKGRIKEMNLRPQPLGQDNPPTEVEMLVYFLVQNGNDVCRQWNWNF